MDNVIYYILALLVIVIAIVVIKKVAGCTIKSIAFAIAVGVLLLIYFGLLR